MKVEFEGEITGRSWGMLYANDEEIDIKIDAEYTDIIPYLSQLMNSRSKVKISIESVVTLDEDKIITWATRHKAEIGKEYYCAHSVSFLKTVVTEDDSDYKGVLLGIDDNTFATPFSLENDSVAREELALYPVE